MSPWRTLAVLVLLCPTLGSAANSVLGVPLAKAGTNDRDRRNCAFVHRNLPLPSSGELGVEVATAGNNALAGLVFGYDPATSTGWYFGLDDRLHHGISIYRFKGERIDPVARIARVNETATLVRLSLRWGDGLRFSVGGEEVQRLDGTLPGGHVGLLGLRMDHDAGTWFENLRGVAADGSSFLDEEGAPLTGWHTAVPPLVKRFKPATLVSQEEPIGLWRQPPRPEPHLHHRVGFGVPGRGKIALRKGFAFVPPGEGELQIVDIRAPEQPRTVAFLPAGFLAGVAFLDDALLLPSSLGLLHVDISDPAHPGVPVTVPVKTLGAVRAVEPLPELPGLVFAATPHHDTCFYLLDLSDPPRPKTLASLRVKGSRGAWYFLREGPRVYLGLNDGSLGVVEVSDPRKPRLLARVATPAGRERRFLAVRDRIVLLSEGKNNHRFNRLELLDVSDPTIPRSLAARDYGTEVNFEDAAVVGPHVLAVDSIERQSLHSVQPFRQTRSAVHVLTTTSLEPVSIHAEDDLGKLRTISIEGDLVALNDYNLGLRLYRLRPDGSLLPLGKHLTAAEGHYLAAGDGLVAFGQTFGGSVLFFRERGDVMERIGEYWDGKWLQAKPVLHEGHLFLPSAGSLTVLDVRDPARPRKTGELLEFPGLLGDLHTPRIRFAGPIAVVLGMVEVSHRRYVPALGMFSFEPKTGFRLLSSITLPEREGNAFTPTLEVEDETVYVLDPVLGVLQRFEVGQGKLAGLGTPFSDPHWKNSGRFNIDYLGRFGVHRGLVAALHGGPVEAWEPSLYLIDCNGPVPRLVETWRLPYPSYWVDVVRAADGFVLGDYFGLGFTIHGPGTALHCASRYRFRGSNAWTAGQVVEDRLYYPRLDGPAGLILPPRAPQVP